MVTVDIRMPLLGETVEEGTITAWLVEPGDDIKEGDAIFEVSTDKVDSEVPAPLSGRLVEIVAEEMETVPVGAIVARVSGDDGGSEAVLERTPSRQESAVREFGPDPVESAPPSVSGQVPEAGTLARVDPRRYPPLPVRTAPTRTAERSSPAISETSRDLSMSPSAGGRFVPYTPIRRTIGARMIVSQRTAAQTLVVMEADYEAIYRARRKAAELESRPEGLSYLPFVLHSIVDAIRDFPLVNAHVTDDGVHVYEAVHLGIAVDLDYNGLVVPVLRGAQDLRLLGLARAALDVAGRARAGTLRPDDYAGGTFTVTNPGRSGTVLGAPIINPPQAAIVETDGVARRVVPIGDEEDAIGVRRRGNLSMTYDHRAFDGAYASAFLRQVCDILEGRDWEQDLAP